jgi:hypothetical protein
MSPAEARNAPLPFLSVLVRAVGVILILAAAIVPQANAANPTVAVSPPKGPPGAIILVRGSGFEPAGQYVVCIVESSAVPCPFSQVMLWSHGNWSQALSGAFNGPTTNVVNGTQINRGTSFFIPGWDSEKQGNYLIAVFSSNTSSTGASGQPLASAQFLITFPTIVLTGGNGPSGTEISFSRSGLLPSTIYIYCLGPPPNAPPTPAEPRACPTGSPSFATDSNGTIPSGVSLQIPSGTASGPYAVLFDQQGSGTNTILAPFALEGSTVAQCYGTSNCYPSGFPWLIVSLVVIAAVVLIVAIFVVRRRRAKPLAAPAPTPTEDRTIAVVTMSRQLQEFQRHLKRKLLLRRESQNPRWPSLTG